MTSTAKKHRTALGSGLDALLPDRLEGEFFLCPVEEIHPSPYQPRQHFPEGTLEELAQSIREKGLIQPVIVRRSPEGSYELIAGERRWRAAQRAGLTEVPAIVREADEEEVLELALVENLQREDLNPVEEAQAYRLLLDRTRVSQDALAARIGKSRVAVVNALRLLTLPPDALEALRDGTITAGHARAILTASGDAARLELLRQILRRGLSVREAEQLARRSPAEPEPKPPKDANVRDLENRLARRLGTRVAVQPGRRKGAGSIRIDYRSLDDLDRLLSLLESSGR